MAPGNSNDKMICSTQRELNNHCTEHNSYNQTLTSDMETVKIICTTQKEFNNHCTEHNSYYQILTSNMETLRQNMYMSPRRSFG